MRFEDFLAYAHPFFCPGDVVFLFDLVVVFIVFVANIKWRIGEDKVGERLINLTQNLNTVAAYYPVE